MPRAPSSLLTMRDASQKLLRDIKVSQLTRDIGALLNPSAANESIILHLIPSPDPTTDEAAGTMVGRHVFVEVTNYAKADFAPSVALHETIHYLYDSVPPETHRDRVQMFLARSYPRASSFYTLFNEALAVAAQHLLDIRMGKDDAESEEIPTAMHTFRVPGVSSRLSSINGSPGAAALTSSSCKPTWTDAPGNLPLISPVPGSCWSRKVLIDHAAGPMRTP
jgi:hypothetical protein